MEHICSRNMKVFLILFLFLSGAYGFAQKTSTVQPKPKAQNTTSVQTDPAGKEKEFMSIEEYERKYNMGTLEIFTIAEQQAEFPGGSDSLNAFVKNTIKYPEKEKQAKLGGKCYIKFIVLNDGNITDAKIEKGIAACPECDKEALRVVQSMPHWKPAMSGGKAVNVYYILPISFEP